MYAPIAYVDANTVKRLLRTSANKVRIGNSAGELSEADLAEYILDAGRFIDGYIRSVCKSESVPIVDYTEVPEVVYAAGRIAAFLIVRDMYSNYRVEQLGEGVTGWLQDGKEFLEMLKQHIDMGVYPALSPATGGLQFVTAEQYFQTEIGVCSMKADQINSVPLKLDNIGPQRGL